MVDFAGLERMKEFGATGDKLTATNHTNKSLSNIGNVIMALDSNQSHIPYRNSMITALLEEALGGTAKSLMFVNISPKEECISETLQALRFAANINTCRRSVKR